MSLSLPPLTALRAFEAAARHLSFAKAAEELFVTPAALSYQIKSLETHLGAPLFHRHNRAVTLAPAGHVLLPHASEAFAALHSGWRAARKLQETSTLSITAGPALTAKWLAPRLFRFAEAYPALELRFIATLRLLDFDRDDVDIAIRFGKGSDAGLFSETFSRDFATPMMRPEIAARLTGPADLLSETLIHDDSLSFLDPSPDWARWFAAAGVAHETLRGPRFSQADIPIDLALEGAGIALGRTSISTGPLRSGQLVAPFKLALTSPAHYRLVCPLGAESRPAVALFRDWAKSEIARDAVLVDRFEAVRIE